VKSNQFIKANMSNCTLEQAEQRVNVFLDLAKDLRRLSGVGKRPKTRVNRNQAARSDAKFAPEARKMGSAI
jgi:hypothetical protein